VLHLYYTNKLTKEFNLLSNKSSIIISYILVGRIDQTQTISLLSNIGSENIINLKALLIRLKSKLKSKIEKKG
jgi:hypothetical protein